MAVGTKEPETLQEALLLSNGIYAASCMGRPSRHISKAVRELILENQRVAHEAAFEFITNLFDPERKVQPRYFFNEMMNGETVPIAELKNASGIYLDRAS